MKTQILLLSALLTLNCLGQTYSTKWTDINYADDNEIYHLLDIYLPATEKEAYPVVVYIYGSAWYSNNQKGADINTIGSALLDAGYAVVTPNHRSSGDTLFPGQIHDIKAAIRFLRGNSELFKLDTSFIGISGSSSGGHLAALAGTSGLVIEFTIDSITMNIEGNLGSYTSFSSEVDAVCDWFGPTDLLVIDSCRGSSFGAPGQTPEEVLIGESKTENKTRFKLANPISYVDSTNPPFLIFHGDADNVVPYCESELLHNALLLSGIESEYFLIPGGQHYTGVHNSSNISKMIEFFNEISGNDTSDSSNNSTSFYSPINNSSIKLYPNPTNENISIAGMQKIANSDYEIFDIYGKSIINGKINRNIIDVSILNKGLYFIKLNSKEVNDIEVACFIKK
ncbi:MAG: prolyl oligopeptidase family serine peptidase [Bacteroidales bacterium]|nr:prolyl oligopeptidase family serine peptidase [Bacteroidales bacterium]MBN2819952.1 prolyl oligopeptidase family serine peptidase [Bacteroidales bacterium]